MRRIFRFIIFIITIESAAFSQVNPINCLQAPIFLTSFPGCYTGEYILAFDDEFDGNTLDTSKWQLTYNTGEPATSYNQEFNTLNNVVVSGGICSIIAKKDTLQGRVVSYLPDTALISDGLPNLRTFYYTSANIYTKKLFSQGKYEIRCKLPAGMGFWPAFWVFGGPQYSEIDFFEIFGSDVNTFTCNIHNDFVGDGTNEDCEFKEKITNFSQWHTITCIYDFDKITWYVDIETNPAPVRTFYRVENILGNPIKCGENIGVGTYYQQKAFPIEKMRIIVNLAIQNRAYSPNASTPFPSEFDIDYVRYWQQTDCCHDLPIAPSLKISFTVNPNPTEGKITVDLKPPIYPFRISTANVFFNLYNTMGALVFRTQLTENSSSIDLTGGTVSVGIYFYSITIPDGLLTEGKLIIIN